MLASYWDMGTSFVFGYVLSAVGGILLGAALVRAGAFGRAAGWLLVVANVVGLGIFLPGVGIAVSLVSVLLLWVWYLRIGWSLAQMVRRGEPRPNAVAKPVAATAWPEPSLPHSLPSLVAPVFVSLRGSHGVEIGALAGS